MEMHKTDELCATGAHVRSRQDSRLLLTGSPRLSTLARSPAPRSGASVPRPHRPRPGGARPRRDVSTRPSSPGGAAAGNRPGPAHPEARHTRVPGSGRPHTGPPRVLRPRPPAPHAPSAPRRRRQSQSQRQSRRPLPAGSVRACVRPGPAAPPPYARDSALRPRPSLPPLDHHPRRETGVLSSHGRPEAALHFLPLR